MVSYSNVFILYQNFFFLLNKTVYSAETPVLCGYNTNNISYHTSASGIWKNIALLRPISNEAECIYIQANLPRDHRTHKTQVVILAVQCRFLSPLHSVKSDWRISVYLKTMSFIPNGNLTSIKYIQFV